MRWQTDALRLSVAFGKLPDDWLLQFLNDRNNGTCRPREKSREFRSGFEYRIGDTWCVGAKVGVKTMHSLLLYGVAGFTQAEISDECRFRDGKNA